MPEPQPATFRFGPFESRNRTRELYKYGLRLKIRPQPWQVLNLLLSRAGYSVLIAFDGQEGFEVATRERPRLVVSDVLMPRVDGIGLCRMMRGHEKLRDTPILLVSAIRKDSESVVEGLKAGADDYLEAPYDPNLLLTKVAQLVKREETEEALRESKEILQKIFDHIPVMVSFFDADGRLTLVNREWERTVGWTPEEVREQNLDIFAECYPDPEERRKVRDFLATSNGHWADFYAKVRDGRVIVTTWAVVRLSDGTSISIGQDITERKRDEERLRKSNENLRALAARLQAVREEESIKIAREIHDELGGGLTGLKMDVSWIERRLPGAGDEAVRQKLRSMSELIDETIQKVRNISTELRPSVLDDLGLAAAVEWQAREFQRRTEIECVITSLDEEVALSAEKSTAVFRIFQEVLTNVARHARATRVEISMEKRDGDLVLKVCDDGRGIRESDISDTRSLGLLGMRERAVVFGGVVEIEGGSGRGTTVTVSIPRE